MAFRQDSASEITLPRATSRPFVVPAPAEEPARAKVTPQVGRRLSSDRPGARERWVVQLELGSEQIARLHRLGFARGAFVWKNGLREWYPLLLINELRQAVASFGSRSKMDSIASGSVPRPPAVPSDLGQLESLGAARAARPRPLVPPGSGVVRVLEPSQDGPLSSEPAVVMDRPEFLPSYRRSFASGSIRLRLPTLGLALLGVAVLSATLAYLHQGSTLRAEEGRLAAALASEPAPREPRAVALAKSTAPTPEAGAAAGIPTVTTDALPLLEASQGSEPSRVAKADRRRPGQASEGGGSKERARPVRFDPEAPVDRGALASAMSSAAAAASGCGSGGTARVQVTFAPSGAARSVRLVSGVPEGADRSCILRQMSHARVPAFSGEPVTVSKTVRF